MDGITTTDLKQQLVARACSYELANAIADEIDRLRAELETLQNGLKDPAAVLVNMMRGHIANPHADTAKRNDELCAENERIRALAARQRAWIDGVMGQSVVKQVNFNAGIITRPAPFSEEGT